MIIQSIDCDVSISVMDYGYQFKVNANLSKTTYVIPTKNEAINECIWLRTLGVKIPDYVIDKLRSEDV